MGNFSKFDISIIVAFVILAALGVGGWWYTSGWITEAEKRIDTEHLKLMALNREDFTPSAANIERLKENQERLGQAIDPIIEQRLAPADSRLDQIMAMNPVSWKTDKLQQAVNRMRDLLGNKAIGTPDNFWFSFAQYQNSNPSEANTQLLGKQLYAIEQLVTILANAGEPPAVQSIDRIKRTFDEYGAFQQGGRRDARTTSEDQLGMNVQEVDGLYRVYPFAVTFTGNTRGLRKFLDGLVASGTVFVVRAVQVQNSRGNSPTLSEVQGLVDQGTNKTFAYNFDEQPGSLPPAVGLQPVFGSESLTITVRVDMIEWLATPEATAGAGETADATGGQS